MCPRIITVLLLVCFIGSCQTQAVSYDGYSLIRIHVNSPLDVQWLQELSDSNVRQVDIWSYPMKDSPNMDILVSPEFFHTLSKWLKNRRLHYYITIKDVASAIGASETDSVYRNRRQANSQHRLAKFPINDYHKFQEIESWLRRLNRTHHRHFHLSSLGLTSEGRNLWLVKLTNGHVGSSDNKRRKPAVFIDAGMHAREWISHATALYLISQLLHHQRDTDSDSVLNGIDWYIVPVANPDGYAYSMETDRLWRKSRSIPPYHPACKGVDINRNFAYHWGEAGSNTRYPCSNVYAGSFPFSEVETDWIASKLRQLAPTLKAYISLHSYGQFWLVPWGYNMEKPKNYGKQSELARKAMAALMRVNQTEYTFGTIADLMYPASGTSVDYAHSLGIPFSLALELRPEDSDTSTGFLYPPENIQPTGQETLEALKAIAAEVVQQQ